MANREHEMETFTHDEKRTETDEGIGRAYNMRKKTYNTDPRDTFTRRPPKPAPTSTLSTPAQQRALSDSKISPTPSASELAPGTGTPSPSSTASDAAQTTLTQTTGKPHISLCQVLLFCDSNMISVPK